MLLLSSIGQSVDTAAAEPESTQCTWSQTDVTRDLQGQNVPYIPSLGFNSESGRG